MFSSHSNKKKSFKIILVTVLAQLVLQPEAKAQKELNVVNGLIQYSDAPNALYHHIAEEAYGYLDKRSHKVAAIKTLSGWQERQKWIKKTLAEAVGPFPEKTALNAKVTKVISKDGYTVEHIIYESQPGYFVTSSLFIPDGLKGSKAPAIIYCSGHSATGYRSYQNILINLVKKGFIVFAFDPISQGERIQYPNAATGKPSFKWPAFEHSYIGAQSFITGNTLAGSFIWDGIRAVDYLLTRKEVDTTRIGINGRSGGGTISAYLGAFDERIKAVAPENYITNFTRLFQTIGPQDAEQDLFYGIKKGLDMADLLAVRAPKPTLMIATTQDMFPIQGAMETAKEVAQIYKAFGKQENFAMVADDAPHASTKKNREAMYAFFQKTLNNPGDSTDKEVTRLTNEELEVTETGQVNTALKSETAFTINRRDAEKRMQKLEAVRKSIPGYFVDVLTSAKGLSGYVAPTFVSEPIFTGRLQRQGYVIEKYILKGEGEYVIPYFLLKPEAPTGKAVIYLNPSGKVADVAASGDMEWFVKNGITVLAPDLIGTGEMGPGSFKGDTYIDSVSYNVWFASMLIGRSIVGIQAGDVLRLTAQLKKDNSIKEIYGLAKTGLSPVLLHAAAFDKSITKVALVEPYSSYRSIVMNPQYAPHFLHSTVPASIGVYDLPDLAASLAPRKLLVVGATDGNANNSNATEIDKDLSVIRDSYQRTAPGQLNIIPPVTKEKVYEHFKSWIEK